MVRSDLYQLALEQMDNENADMEEVRVQNLLYSKIYHALDYTPIGPREKRVEMTSAICDLIKNTMIEDLRDEEESLSDKIHSEYSHKISEVEKLNVKYNENVAVDDAKEEIDPSFNKEIDPYNNTYLKDIKYGYEDKNLIAMKGVQGNDNPTDGYRVWVNIPAYMGPALWSLVGGTSVHSLKEGIEKACELVTNISTKGSDLSKAQDGKKS
tara:strand:+ start:2692 stop:3324 length:633 start_codon:yes stop_codon:yes gene_type:complete